MELFLFFLIGTLILIPLAKREKRASKASELAEAMLIKTVADAQPGRVDPVQLAKAEIVLIVAKQRQSTPPKRKFWSWSGYER